MVHMKVYIQWLDNGIFCGHKKYPAICDNINGLWGHYAEWNKSKTNSEWSHLYVQSKQIETENKVAFARGRR